MSNRPDPEEGIVLELTLLRPHLADRLDAATLRHYDQSLAELGRIVRARRALDTVIRCGDTEHSRKVAKDAGLAFIADGKEVSNIREFGTETKKRRDRTNDPDAA